MLENKLGITNEVDLSKEEERITKLKALELFDSHKINEFEVGTFKGLADIHIYLFSDIYDFNSLTLDNLNELIILSAILSDFSMVGVSSSFAL